MKNSVLQKGTYLKILLAGENFSPTGNGLEGLTNGLTSFRFLIFCDSELTES